MCKESDKNIKKDEDNSDCWHIGVKLYILYMKLIFSAGNTKKYTSLQVQWHNSSLNAVTQ